MTVLMMKVTVRNGRRLFPRVQWRPAINQSQAGNIQILIIIMIIIMITTTAANIIRKTERKHLTLYVFWRLLKGA